MRVILDIDCEAEMPLPTNIGAALPITEAIGKALNAQLICKKIDVSMGTNAPITVSLKLRGTTNL